MRIVLITGISGSGKSVALHMLEDTGYFCVDNLPPALLRSLVETRLKEGEAMLAVATDARSADSLTELGKDIQSLKDEGHDVKVFFLTASTESLITRFSETRRSHPLSHRALANQQPNYRRTLTECIQLEREMLSGIQSLAHVIDTSNLSANKLRSWIQELIDGTESKLTLLFESFGFKYGVPLDADMVFDVRFLPNPHYDPQLRPLTGKDAAVAAFLSELPEVDDLFDDIRHFVEKWLPAFKRDNRSYLTVAIGCTGGQHRSVFIAEKLTQYFSDKEHVVVRHLQLN
jgi:RNase adapter protein RapZ